ncbi:MAG TPA: Rho termination factor N-terminal domain-containing protein, partial [Solirubrobacterales bacterium]
MTKTELEKKHLSDLHLLASEAGIEKYRLLTKSELVDRLAEDNGDGGEGQAEERPERQERPRRRRRGGEGRERGERSEKAPEREREAEPPAREERPEPAAKEEPSEPAEVPAPAEAPRPRRRRRRRFGRRKQGVTLQTLLLPPEAGRQALVFAESREGCTALLRSVAADLAADSKGPDPVALLIDPTPEELADWKREAPQAEIVSAGQPRHASDALAQAAARSGKGEDVILLVDSLTRL